MKKLLLILCAACAFAAPRVNFTDLTSGPAVPANGGTGALVTIFGNRFGATRGASTVKFGSTEAAAYLFWSDTKVSVQVPGSLANGAYNITVRVASEDSNTDVQFTVAGNSVSKIYYFDPADHTGASTDTCSSPRTGSLASPYRYYYVNKSSRDVNYYVNTCAVSGDIVYVRAGTMDTQDGNNFNYTVLNFKTKTSLSVVAYPGETAILDARTYFSVMRYPVTNSPASTTMAGFLMYGGPQGTVLWSGSNTRFVGNTFNSPDSCVNYVGGIEVGKTLLTGNTGADANSGIKILGNEITNVGTNCASGVGTLKTIHSIYAKCTNCEIAWNYLHGNKTYNGIQLHDDALTSSKSNSGFYNVLIHDNWIEDQNGNAINLSTIDFPTGSEYLRIYNNVLKHAGAVALTSGESTGQIKACIALKDAGRTAAVGTIEVFDNTMVDCTALFDNVTYGNTSTSGAIYKGGSQASITLDLTNNIVYAPAYYWTDAARGVSQLTAFLSKSTNTCCTGQITGSNNLWFSALGETAPSSTTSNVTSDPLFLDLAGDDLSLASNSPAIDAAVDAGLVLDIVGRPRPSGSAQDIGAYEWVTSAVPLSISTTSLSDGVQSVAYSQTLIAAGGAGGNSWDLSVGTLPAGLSLDAGTGVISGTPSGTGTTNFTARVTDSAMTAVTQALSITVAGGDLTVTPTALGFTCVHFGANPASQNLAVGSSGSITLDNWSATKSASWLTLSPTSGSAAGTITVSVSCTGLAVGVYTDVVSIPSTTSGIGATPQLVPVALTVTPAPPSTCFGCKCVGCTLR